MDPAFWPCFDQEVLAFLPHTKLGFYILPRDLASKPAPFDCCYDGIYAHTSYILLYAITIDPRTITRSL